MICFILPVLILCLAHEVRVLVSVFISTRKENPERWLIKASPEKKSFWQAVADWEKRFWLYVVIVRPPGKHDFEGEYHAGTGLQGGNAASWKGWAIINLIPAPIIHLLIYHKSHMAADTVSLACLMVSTWLWSEYRASCIRPVSVDSHYIYLRYGLLTDKAIEMTAVDDLRPIGYRDSIGGTPRYAGLGSPNVLIYLKDGDKIAIGVDDPNLFIRDVQNFLNASVSGRHDEGGWLTPAPRQS